MINTRGIPEEERKILAAAYDLVSIPNLDTERFLGNIDWRLYTEHCMDGHLSSYGWGNAYEDYEQVMPIRQWINDETHYALERLVKDSPQKINDAVYRAMRIRVVQAIAHRAIELLSTWEKHQWPPNDDPRNLRASLASYLDPEYDTSGNSEAPRPNGRGIS
ncbi:MAG: hypothetical protein AAB728_01305 [Patescibacteria group bacterium]